jgi:hypothetical protein
MTLRRSWQVYQTGGESKPVIDKAVDETLFSVLILLLSFV